jgi:futalosine hydrolase
MPDRARILVVAATARELAAPNGWRTLLCGVGPVESAAATAAELERERPALVLHVGIAGGNAARGFAPGTLVIGTEARYCDLSVGPEWAPNTVVAEPALVALARQALPSSEALPIGTSARIGGTYGCDVEAMEGFGVLRAAQRAGLPAIEIRAISNDINEPDRGRWHFAEAFAAITAATPGLVDALARSLEP